jgi:probable selenium-dependent hydroxylase accessory protein YqeC
VQLAVRETLTAALGLVGRDVVALVGGGGKTGALQLLARELAAAGHCVLATTTTAMFLRELAVVGPVLLGPVAGSPPAGLEDALACGRAAAVALGEGAGGKVVGLPPAEVDALWTRSWVDYVIVEADGSRGKPLKAFAAHEPQLPTGTGTIVQVAGLDAVGGRLNGEHVHRPELLAEALGVRMGSVLTPRLVAGALRCQMTTLRRLRPDARIVTLLNKADGPDDEARALAIGGQLLGAGEDVRAQRPDDVVVASLHAARFGCVVGEA